MIKTYKFRIYPNKSQISLIEQHFGNCRVVYNYFLNFWQTEFKKGNKVNYYVVQKELTNLKKNAEYSWLNNSGSQSLQISLRHLDSAYTKFFRNQGGYPKYKSKKNLVQSFTAPQNINIEDKKLIIPKFKDGIKIKQHRQFPKDSILKQATITKQCNQYYVSIMFDDGKDIPSKVKAKNAVGLDVGISDFVVTSDSKKYENKQFFVKSQKKLTRLQRRFSRKQKDSNNFKKFKLKIQKLHLHIKNQRQDYQHKISNEITNYYDIICVETLNVKYMLQNKYLSKSISDVSWSEFIRQLEYKSEYKGKTLVKIDKWFPSSQLCSKCGYNTGQKPLNIRKFKCPKCNTELDRDINAAINIRDFGYESLQNRYTTGTVEIQACGESIKQLEIILDDSLKQEAKSSLAAW